MSTSPGNEESADDEIGNDPSESENLPDDEASPVEIRPSVQRPSDTHAKRMRDLIPSLDMISGVMPSQAELAEWALPYGKIVAEAQKSIQFIANNAIIGQFRVADFVIPESLRGVELASTAYLSDVINAQSALSGWRHSLLAEESALAIAATSALRFEPIAASLLADLAHISGIGANLAEMATRLSGSGAFAAVLSQPPALQLHRYLDGLPEPPSIHQLSMGVQAGRGVAGLVSAEVATLDEVELDEALGRIEDEVVTPWRTGPSAAREEMLSRLGEIDKSVPDLLNGAWDDVTRAGPAAAVKVATCAVEALERTLRALAPDDVVLVWHKHNNRPEGELDAHGGPTYSVRARYVMRSRRGERKLVVSQVDAVAAQIPELRNRLQAGKHASSGSIAALRALLVSTEAVLLQLTFEE